MLCAAEAVVVLDLINVDEVTNRDPGHPVNLVITRREDKVEWRDPHEGRVGRWSVWWDAESLEAVLNGPDVLVPGILLLLLLV